MSELELLNSCKKGDLRAQEALYHQYKGKLFGVCLRYAENYQEAEDFLQEGFILIFKDIHQFQPYGSLEGWMRKVVINVALQHLRRKKRLLPTTSIEPFENFFEGDDNPWSDLNAKSLIRMIQSLPDGYRTVFNLYVIEGYSHVEISELLQISPGTSKSQLSRAKATLRAMIQRSLIT